MNPTRSVPERWLPVPGYEGYYEVSDQGNVRSIPRVVNTKTGPRRLPGRMLRQVPCRSGHIRLCLNKDGVPASVEVHRLVAAAFIGPRPDGMFVCHWNDDPSDNRVENLRYATPAQNVSDAVRNKKHKNSKKTHCSRGHELVGGNLRPSDLKKGKRSCLACNRAHSRVSDHPELRPHIQEISDSYYATIERTI